MRHLAMRLRFRIVALAFVPTMVLLGAIATFSVITFHKTAAELVIARNHDLTVLLAGQIGTEMALLAEPLVDMSMQREMLSLEPSHQATILHWSIGTLRAFDAGVLVLDREGIVVAADPRCPELVGQDWSDRLFVERLRLPVGHTFVSDIERLGPERRPVIAVCVKMRTADHPYAGAIVGMYSLSTDLPNDFYRCLNRAARRSNTNLFVVDSRGKVIDPKRLTPPDTDASHLGAVTRVLSGESGAVESSDLWNNRTITSFAPIPDTPWGLIEEQRWDQIMVPSETQGRLMVGLLILGLVIPPTLLAVAMKRIIQPIRHLTHAASAMARGELRQSIVAPPGDEIGEMADAFNSMSEQLVCAYAGLEERVAARTHDLETLYDITLAASQTLELEELLDVALQKTLDALALECGSITYNRGRGQQHVCRSLDMHSPSAPIEANAFLTFASTDGTEHMLRAPLVARGDVVGRIVVDLGSDSAENKHDQRLLEAIGRGVGVAANNAYLYSLAEEAAASRERNRIARELHDSVTQTLFSANLIAGVLPLLLDKEPELCPKQARELHQLTQGALAEMRMLLLELRPDTLRKATPAEILPQLAAAASAHGKLTIQHHVDPEIVLTAEQTVAFYRIAQESLNNVMKHARASRVQIELVGEANSAQLSITDDGIGFPQRQSYGTHLGLTMMRERAEGVGGTLKIEPMQPSGTRIIARCPMKALEAKT